MGTVEIVESWGKKKHFVLRDERELRDYLAGRYCPCTLLEELSDRFCYSLNNECFFEAYNKLLDTMIEDLEEWFEIEARQYGINTFYWDYFQYIIDEEDSAIHREIEITF